MDGEASAPWRSAISLATRQMSISAIIQELLAPRYAPSTRRTLRSLKIGYHASQGYTPQTGADRTLAYCIAPQVNERTACMIWSSRTYQRLSKTID